VGLPESVKSSGDSSSSVYAGKDERFDVKHSYRECPECKTLLKITTDLQGTVLKLEYAPTIKE
jgi:hypothetical protein